MSTNGIHQNGTMTFDYIVVGGGTGGLAIATRLAESKKFTVAVIEAGDYRSDDPKINIPGMFNSIVGDPEYDWMHMAVSQPGLGGGTQHLPRGKVLGGTSAMNTMAWNRPSREEYDVWETLGNEGWNWDTIFNLSKRTEAVTPAPPNTPPSFLYTHNPSSHGTSGPIKLSYPKWSSDIVPVVFDTMKECGIPLNKDPNGGSNIGGISLLSSVDSSDSTRSYSVSAFYAKHGSNNLVTINNAIVTKINLSSTPDENGDYAATGVTYTSNGQTYTVNVNKEVIVSCGTLKTPQILELSGIGNKDILTKAGIEPIIDLPGVGENLQDHMQLNLTAMELVPGYTTRDVLNDPQAAAKFMDAYNADKSGPYSSSLASVGYFPLSTFVGSETKSTLLAGLDKELAAAKGTLKPLDSATYSLARKWLDGDKISALEFLIFPLFIPDAATPAPKPNTSYLSFGLVPQHTFARGSVHISSNDPHAQPLIDPKYFSWNFDKKMMVEAVKFVIDFIRKDPIKSAIAHHPYDATWTDEFIEDYVTKSTGSGAHFVGTAAMLPRSQGGVVDSNLKVHGTSNLRIVDASVMPNQISAHTQATIYAIAEAACEKILLASA